MFIFSHNTTLFCILTFNVLFIVYNIFKIILVTYHSCCLVISSSFWHYYNPLNNFIEGTKTTLNCEHLPCTLDFHILVFRKCLNYV